MRPDLVTVTEKVIALRRSAAQAPARAALLEQIEDLLSEGYAQALAGDAWSMHVEERMFALIDHAPAEERVELGSLAAEHMRFQRELIGLRDELSELRRARDRLCATSRAASG